MGFVNFSYGLSPDQRVFKHPTCQVVPWAVFTAPQLNQQTAYNWSGFPDILNLFTAKGYRPTEKLIGFEEMQEKQLFTQVVTSCGKESAGFRAQFVCYSMAQIRQKDSSAEKGWRVLYEYKPPAREISVDRKSVNAAQAASVGVALRGIPNCQVDPAGNTP